MKRYKKSILLIVFTIIITLRSFSQIQSYKLHQHSNKTDSLVWIYTSLIKAESYILSDIHKIDKTIALSPLNRSASDWPDTGVDYFRSEVEKSKEFLMKISTSNDSVFLKNTKLISDMFENNIALTDSCYQKKINQQRIHTGIDHLNKSKCDGSYYSVGVRIICVKHENDSTGLIKSTENLNQWKETLQRLMRNLNETKLLIIKLIVYCNKDLNNQRTSKLTGNNSKQK